MKMKMKLRISLTRTKWIEESIEAKSFVYNGCLLFNKIGRSIAASRLKRRRVRSKVRVFLKFLKYRRSFFLS